MARKNKIKDAERIQRENGSDCVEAELRYGAVFDQSPDGILIIDSEGKIVDFNKAAHTDLGYSREEFSKLSISDIDPVESPEEICASIEKTMREKKAEFEVTHRTKSGQLRNVLVITQTIFLSGRTVLHTIWRDITEQKAAGKALMESEAKYRDLFENAGDAIFVLDSELRYVDVNRRGLDLLGYTREELLGRQPFDFIPEEQRLHSTVEFKKLKRGGSYENFEGRIFTKDGRCIDIEVSSTAIFSGGAFAGSRDIVRDITGRKRIEKALQQREESLARSQMIAHLGDWEWDIATNEVHWSDELYRIYGFEPHEIAPDYGLILARMHPGSKDEFMQAIDAALRQDRHFEMDYRFYRKDGSEAMLHTIGQVVRDVTGSPVRMFGIVQDITERKRTEERLLESEDRFHSIFLQTLDGIMIADAATKRLIEANRAICTMLGYTPDEIIGLSIRDIHPAGDLPRVMSTLERQMRGDISLAEDVPMLKKNRSVFYADISAAVISLGGRQCLLGVFRDTTERKRAEEALRENEEKFSKMFRQAPLLITLSDIETGRMIDVNDRYLEISGFSRDEVIGRSVLELGWISEEQRSRMVRTLRERGRVSGMELSLRRGDGKTVVCLYSGETITVRGQRRLLSMAQDITERKWAEEALSRSEERYRRLFEDSSISLWEEDFSDLQEHFDALRSSGIADFRAYFADHPEEVYKCVGLVKIISVNKATVALYEAPDKATLLKDLSPVFTSQSFESFREIMVALAGGARTYECEAVNRTLTGRKINVLLRWSLLSGTEDRGTHALISIIDITDRKVAEEKLRQSEEFIRNILDTVDEGFIVIDRDFRIMTANKAYCEQVGEPCDSVIGRHCYEISHKTPGPCYEEGEECAVHHVFQTGEPHAALHKHPDARGSVLYVETKAFPIKDGTGAVISAIETVNNITEKHLLEEEQLKTQKLEAIGTLAGGIAHDFNNLLQGVFGYISMAKIVHDQKQKSLDMLEHAEQALHMSVNLTSQLLTFSKGGKPVTKRITLRPVMENSVKFALSGSRVDYSIQVDEELRMVEADEGQIGQVIQNLVLNAEQAMPMGGTITVTARNVSSRRKGLSPVLRQGNYVEISIKDSGIGIPKQYLLKIFDPYFTTKDKGSGLGLATSYSIIKNHGGLIDVKSKLGEGTTFFVYIPAVETKEVKTEILSASVRPVRKGRILLMDDEDIVRNIAGVMIGSLGHEVELAEDGKEAIARYRESMKTGRGFDIVILDLTIRGGMGGEETIKELREIDPDIRAIVSSGYADSSVISEYKATGFKACLTKPYDIDSLNSTLNSLLS
jgi:PAS domain S-box-containing protein